MGGRLVPALLDRGYRVRCLVREPRKLEERVWRVDPRVTVIQSDLSNPPQLAKQIQGCAAAYYLIHSMVASGRDFAERDSELARNFALAAAQADIGRIIYLGGLGELGDVEGDKTCSRIGRGWKCEKRLG